MCWEFISIHMEEAVLENAYQMVCITNLYNTYQQKQECSLKSMQVWDLLKEGWMYYFSSQAISLCGKGL